MRSKKGETGKCTCKIFLSLLFLCPQFSRTIVLSVRPQFSRAIRKAALRAVVCRQFSRAIRKAALRAYVASTVQLAPFAKPHYRAYRGWRRIFAHKRALSSSDCQQPDSYASINLPPDIRWLNCWFKNRVCSIFFVDYCRIPVV